MYTLMMTANGHVDPRGSIAPPIIMRTAATPMPTPKSSLGPESILGDDFICREGVSGEVGIGHTESRRGSSTSMDPSAYDQRSLVSCIKDDGEKRSLTELIRPITNQKVVILKSGGTIHK